MKHHFRDITDKLGVPDWYDENGTPRYCEFSPAQTAHIYASEAVLLEIACQNCGKLFNVCMSWDILAFCMGRPSLSDRVRNGTIHYGDPPNSGCCPAGPTMNSEPIRCLQFWTKDESTGKWHRDSKLEIIVVEKEAS